MVGHRARNSRRDMGPFPMSTTPMRSFNPCNKVNPWSDPSLLISIWYSHYPATKPASIQTKSAFNKHLRTTDTYRHRVLFVTSMLLTLNSRVDNFIGTCAEKLPVDFKLLCTHGTFS
ncbi:hypothetical protein PoB_003625400 [Plakobranchus ocellatus]|uniref:Uncharacterized protein n=1 Tax=Plakobranchus ocellatus TaxID=259542 RepID=A0AAV4AUH4_9GAST|nr:hypothetical protein PoB_003625400 [Plakobranchus ocellatus]